MNDHLDLDQRLRELGAEIPPPAVPLNEDLARGRSRVRRHRLLAAAGTAAAVAIVGLVGTVGPELVSADEQVGYGGGDGTPLPGPETAPPVKPGEREIVPQAPESKGSFPAPLDSGDFTPGTRPCASTTKSSPSTSTPRASTSRRRSPAARAAGSRSARVSAGVTPARTASG